jgi:2-polyprenyl-6-hydroxyphenyl methylase/3-demethylubiquinone-9 3-methyltransferase
VNGDSTVDPREVGFYSRLAARWWDASGPFWPLHTLNRLRVGYIRSRLCAHFGRDEAGREPLSGLQVLDVGCGGGILAESIARLGASVVGIDVVDKNIQVATLHAADSGLEIDYRLCTAAELANAGEQFDVVLNMEVVEHVADLDAFMRDCCRMTRPGGAMFVATINRTPASWLIAIIGAEYILRWLPRGTHRWSWFRKPAEIRRLLQAGGLRGEETVGVAVNPFTKRMRITRLLAVNYMMVSTRVSQPH